MRIYISILLALFLPSLLEGVGGRPCGGAWGQQKQASILIMGRKNLGKTTVVVIIGMTSTEKAIPNTTSTGTPMMGMSIAAISQTPLSIRANGKLSMKTVGKWRASPNTSSDSEESRTLFFFPHIESHPRPSQRGRGVGLLPYAWAFFLVCMAVLSGCS